MTTKVTTAPAIEPISLTDAKTYLRVDYSADDTFITNCIIRARRLCEDLTNLRMYTQVNTSVINTDGMPYGLFTGFMFGRYAAPIKIYLPYGPVTAITEVDYESDFNVWTSLDVSNFSVDYDSMVATLALQSDVEVQAVRTEDGTFRFKVIYQVGYTSLADISPTIIQAMYMLLGEYYTNRNDAVIEGSAKTLLAGERMYLL